MRPDANTTWFNFTAQSGDFGVYAFSGLERVSSPYEFNVELVSLSANVDIAGLLGTPAALVISDRSGGSRPVHGLIREMEQLHTANRFTHYRAILVPRLWFLGQITDHRIFQNMSVVEIIQKILQEQGFDGSASSFKLSQSYEPREYCVQYGESCLHFISRLCEEEGIYFYFEHAEDSHCLCFCDKEGGPPISGESALRHFQGSGQAADTAVISRLRLHHRVNSNAAAYRDWNFTKPKLDLNIEEKAEAEKAPVPDGMNLEQYRYPHLYQLRADGTRYAKLQTARQVNFSRWIELEADVSRFLPSFTFTIYNHARQDVNSGWWVHSVQHQGSQPGVLEHEAPSDRGLHYNAFAVAIPESARYVPEQAHPKNLVVGKQAAIVTGPEGEEIYPDEYGRVKVQFFWDREGRWDEKTTCWIRAAQGWAGGQYGAMAIPRIGHEVIVSFLEGDPDRPLITGRVYHELNQPPYKLPDNKTRTVLFKSFTSPKNGGFNELRVEDKQGEEEIYLRGEKDVNVYVNNDWSDMIGADTHRHTGRNDYALTDGETHRKLVKDRKTLLEAGDHLTVKGSRLATVDGTDQLKAGALHVHAGQEIVLESGSRIVLKVGGTFITLGPEGVTEQGPTIWKNCGKDAPASPEQKDRLQPDPPKGADKGTSPNGGEMAKPMPAKDAQESGSVVSPAPEGELYALAPAQHANEAVVAPQSDEYLTPETKELIEKSPTLQKQIEDSDVTIRYGKNGSGTYYDPDKGIINLDGKVKNNPEKAVQGISHEIGHATSGINRDMSSANAYAWSQLDGEGAATINNCIVRDEILKNTDGVIDIGISGKPGNTDAYMGVYEKYNSGKLSAGEARREIGAIYGKKEAPPWHLNYYDYYHQQAIDVFNLPY